MGLLTFIQIPCHHVLANEISLNLKYGIVLKHFFNINLGIGIIQKLLFLFVLSTYLPVFLLKFRSRELVGCGIKFRIQLLLTDLAPQKQEIPGKRDDVCILLMDPATAKIRNT